MTEPNCLENTKWIINMNHMKISEAQLTEMRKLKTSDTNIDYLQDNNRPVQNLNTRMVNKR